MTQQAEPQTISLEQALQRGLAALQDKRFDEAEKWLKYGLAMEPMLLKTYQGLGEVYVQAKRWAEAASMLERAVALSTTHPLAYYYLGQSYHELRRPADAEQAWRKASELKPDWPPPLWALGDAYRKQHRWEEGIETYERLMTLPGADAVLAKNFKAQCIHGLQRLEEAEKIYLEVIAERPQMPEPYCSLGALYRSLNQLDKVESSYLKAIEIFPNFPEAYYNLGNFYKGEQRYPEAEAMFRKAMAYRPGYIEAEWNLALVLLAQDKYEEGWAAYQVRLNDGYFKLLPANKRWQGQPLQGKRILVMREQGYGDTLQLLRYAPLLKQQGATVLFESKAAITPLLQTCPFIDECLPPRSFQENPNLQYDYWIPLMTLPHQFKATLDNLPPASGLLQVPETLIKHWKKRFAKDKTLKIGISWTGNPENPYNVDREFPLEWVERLANTPGVTLYSLQKENGLPEGYKNTKFKDLAPELDSFLDTAAAIANLDGVISVDSAVAHLAGVLDKPLWVVLPAVADWRWGLQREDSPWYPSAKVLRQTTSGNWEPVFDALQTTLQQKAKGA